MANPLLNACLVVFLHMMLFVSLGVLLSLIIKKLKVINLLVVVENVFLGYPFSKKGWKLYDLDSREFFVFRDVKYF